MINDKKSWPSEEFRPVFSYIRECYPKITPRRAARITKGVLAAQAAVNFTMSNNGRREISGNVSLEGYSADELR